MLGVADTRTFTTLTQLASEQLWHVLIHGKTVIYKGKLLPSRDEGKNNRGRLCGSGSTTRFKIIELSLDEFS